MKTIGTHNGKFHADETFACVLLQMSKDFADSKITRTRDEKILSGMDAVVDVGGVYDPSTHRYDHHQPTFNDTFSPKHKTILSSAGLVYKHFAKEIIAAKLEENGENKDLVNEDTELMYNKLYDEFVEPFDAHDNGISAYPPDIEPKFSRPHDIFAQVNLFNPAWNECDVDADERFVQAMKLMKDTWEATINYYIRSWLPGRSILRDTFHHQTIMLTTGELPDKRILILNQYCPWTDHLFELESVGEPIIYVLYEDSTKSGWRIHAVPKKPDSFECRKALPKAWRGMRDGDLDGLTGVPGSVFVHRAGFIGAHRSREGAVQMANLALKSTDSPQ